MKFVFSHAKNNELTFSINNKYFHSAYNPSSEAEKWVNQIDCNFNPKAIIVLGIGLPYCINYLKKKFYNTKIILVQYSKEIYDKVKIDFSNLFDENTKQVLLNDFKQPQHFSAFLFNNFSEEISNQIIFLSWKPSETFFSEEYSFSLKAIQEYLNKSKDLIATRRYFSKKWISNIIRFFSLSKENFYKIEKGTKDILIIASGHSLKKSLENIKKYKNNFFLISVSSATNVLIKNNIIPDLILTTDGGYWAKKHLSIFKNNLSSIPIICPAEASLPINLLQESKIIPIEYNDFTNKYFFESTKLSTIKTNRNGTVSGSALEIAKQLTTSNIYFIGLDLSNNTGFQHTQPNILEINDSLTDYFFSNKETRISKRNLSFSALNTYKNWFENLPKDYVKNVFRIYDTKTENLGNIETISFENIIFNKNSTTPQIYKQINYKKIDLINLLKTLLSKIENDFQWLKILSLGNILNYEKFTKNIFLEQAISESKDFLINQIKKLELVNDR